MTTPIAERVGEAGAVQRLAVTLAAAAVPAAIGRLVPLPFLDRGTLAALAPFDSRLLSVVSLGISPLLGGFALVEVAAVLVPPWSRLRSVPEGRARLRRAAIQTGAVIALVQTAFFVVALSRQPGLLVAKSLGAQVLLAATLLAGTALLLGLASFVDRHGFASGLAVVAGGGITEQLVSAAQAHLEGANPAGAAAIAVAVVAATSALLTRGPRAFAGSGAPEGATLRHPVAGLLPLNVASFLLYAAALAGTDAGATWGDSLAPGHETYTVLQTLLGAALAVALTALLAGSRPVAAAWARILGGDERALAAPARRTLDRAAAISAGFVAAIVALSAISTRVSGTAAVPVIPLALLTALALDVVSEYRARSADPSLIPVWPLSRPYEVEPALALLRREGIAAEVRSSFWYALVPVTGTYAHPALLVPAADAVRAEALLRRAFAPSAASH